MTVSLSPWLLLALAIPVLFAGEAIRRRVPLLDRFNIPVPVIGGLLFSLLVLTLNLSGLATVSFRTGVTAGWWTWLVTPENEWASRPSRHVNLPFLVGFFTCIGLNATWEVLRRGSWQLLLFWTLATALAAVQTGVGVGVASLLGAEPLLGLICGSLSMTGGHGTALGFAPTLEQAGFAGAATIGAAAATFGLVCGGLLGGPVATRLIRRHALSSRTPAPSGSAASSTTRQADDGLVSQARALVGLGRTLLWPLLILAACIKLGAWVSHYLQAAGWVFPAYMGAMVIGLLVRNLLDLCGLRVLDSRAIDALGGVFLGIFLAMAMSGLNLIELAAAAGPMLVIVSLQVLLMALFATFVTFRLMGRDYDAAIMAGGHCGFGLGATPNAVANMDSLVRRFGEARRAFIIVPTTGAVLIDLSNSTLITAVINLLR
jgi:glutamate:Na+ symporter, ESS family